MPPNRTADHQVRDRRFSTSKPAVFYAPVLLRPAAGWWYSWPSTRTSQVDKIASCNIPNVKSSKRQATSRDLTFGFDSVQQPDIFSETSAREERTVEPMGIVQPEPESSANLPTDRPETTVSPARTVGAPGETNVKSIGNSSRTPVPQHSNTIPENVKAAIESEDSISDASDNPVSKYPSALRGLGPAAANPKGKTRETEDACLDYTEHELHFTLDAKTTMERYVPFTCTKSKGANAINEPPLSAEDLLLATAGNIHIHVYMGGIQYWVCHSDGSWRPARQGSPHPTLGKGRVLSHRPPETEKLPSWVASSTLITYRSRTKKSATGN